MRLGNGTAVGIDCTGVASSRYVGRSIARARGVDSVERGTAIDCDGRTTDRNVSTDGCPSVERGTAIN